MDLSSRIKSNLRVIASGVMLASVISAQTATVEPIEATGNRIMASYKGASTIGSGRDALVQRTDQVFPHIATGGGWETVMVIVNIGFQPVDFSQSFYDDSGNPMQVTFRTYPEGRIVTTSAARGHLNPGSSFNFALFDSSPNLQVGWASLDYDSTNTRLGGYAAFRLKAGGVINEGLVPLSSYNDTQFLMSFDNIQGFATGVALCNPASNISNHVTIAALDLSGAEITRTVMTLPPSSHTSFVLADRMPALAGRMGTLVVQSDTTRLSAVGIRMNVAGGMTFTSIPIMNWTPAL